MKNVYIASCTQKGGIYRYIMGDDGSLNFADKIEADRVMYMTMDKGKLYALLRAPYGTSSESGVIVFDVEGDGRLTNRCELGSTMGEVACHIAADGDDIYCANYISGSIIKLPNTLVKHHGQGAHPIRQTSPHCHFVGFTPERNYIVAVDLGLDTVFVYGRDLSPISMAKVPSGHGARHIVFSKDGQYMFCANELASTISVFSYHDGILSLLSTANALPNQAQSSAAAIRFHDGKIYVSNRGHDSISEFTFEAQKLKLTKNIRCLGSSPRDFDFIDGYMICTNEGSDSVTVFDAKDFRHIGTLTVEKPLCIIGGSNV